MTRVCRERGLELLLGRAAVGVEAGGLVLEGGGRVACDECVWCTGGGGAAWLRDTPLALVDGCGDEAAACDLRARLRDASQSQSQRVRR